MPRIGKNGASGAFLARIKDRNDVRIARKTTISERGPEAKVHPEDPFENFSFDALGAERRNAKEELAHNDAMTSETKMARMLLVV